MANNVRSGFRAGFSISIDTAASSASTTLGLKTGSMRETIEKHDLTATTSPTVSPSNGQPVVQVPRINGKTSMALNVTAQYSSSGNGDPPDFSGGKIYGNCYVSAQMGDTVAGFFLVNDYADMFNVDGTIDYDLNLLNNGAYSRTTGS